MNKEQKKRITQNLTNLKERLSVDLDAIIDILIEEGVFTLDHRGRIETVHNATPQRKFNEFVQILLNSSHPSAYDVFLEALGREGHHYVVERLRNTVVKDIHGTPLYTCRSQTFTSRSLRANKPVLSPAIKESFQGDEAGAAGGEPHTSGLHVSAQGRHAHKEAAPRNAGADLMQVLGKQLDDFRAQMTRDIMSNMAECFANERQMLQEEMETRLGLFRGEWDRERRQLLLQNESKLSELQDKLEYLKVSNEEYNELRRKYDNLQKCQEGMREREQERWQRLKEANSENVKLRRENEELNREIKELKDKIKDMEIDHDVMRSNERNDQIQIGCLKVENARMTEELREKESEIFRLKEEIQSMYDRLQESLHRQQEKNEREDEDFHQVLERQNTRLDELCTAFTEYTSQNRMVFSRQQNNVKPLAYNAPTISRILKRQKSEKN